MVTIVRDNSSSPDFKKLVRLLDIDLNQRSGAIQSQYDKLNIIESLDTVVIAKVDGEAVGCGCFKQYDKETVEIKRMYVRTGYRRLGIATQLLFELEFWAIERGYSKAVLETGENNPEAIRLYKKHGYRQIENYGKYVDFELSLCFAKNLAAA
jgi:ribosomal protein S18 acetylase RimI-like enzyme